MRIGLLFLFCLFTSVGLAQQKVSDAKFAEELSGLLSHSVPEITAQEAAAKRNVVFLDSRKADEFEVSHIKGAIRVGFSDFKMKHVKGLDKNAEIIVYCSVGYRSEKISEKLLKAGFTNVSNLYGGIFEWVHEGNAVENSEGNTEEVHTYNEEWSQWLTKGKKVY